MSTSMRRTRSLCCARAVSGHAAAPPMSVMNSRRLNYLVGGDEQLVGHSEAEHPGGLAVDDQFELARLHNRQVRGFGPLEDADCWCNPC
jgi:uncharacterized protein YchJ